MVSLSAGSCASFPRVPPGARRVKFVPMYELIHTEKRIVPSELLCLSYFIGCLITYNIGYFIRYSSLTDSSPSVSLKIAAGITVVLVRVHHPYNSQDFFAQMFSEIQYLKAKFNSVLH